jgi:hypothetical protein
MQAAHFSIHLPERGRHLSCWRGRCRLVRPRPVYPIFVLLAVIAGGEVAGFAGVIFAVLPQLGKGPLLVGAQSPRRKRLAASVRLLTPSSL